MEEKLEKRARLGDRVSKLLLIVEMIEKDKCNYARRANYKIKKLRKLMVKIANGEDPGFLPEEDWAIPKQEEAREQDKLSEAGETNIKEQPPAEESPTEPPINYDIPIEIDRDDSFNTETWSDNMWKRVHFMDLRRGDLFRILDGAEPIEYNKVNYFQADSGIYKSKETWRHCIRAKYGYIPSKKS